MNHISIERAWNSASTTYLIIVVSLRGLTPTQKQNFHEIDHNLWIRHDKHMFDTLFESSDNFQFVCVGVNPRNNKKPTQIRKIKPEQAN